MITFKNHGTIVAVTFLKTVQDPETALKKTSIVDILCTDQHKNSTLLRCKWQKKKDLKKSSILRIQSLYLSNQKGGEYHHLKEVIFLAISGFMMFPNKTAYKSDHVILDRESHDNDLKDFSFTFMELPKFNMDIDHLSTMSDKWAYFFKNAKSTSLRRC